jgi:hypothetical protein
MCSLGCKLGLYNMEPKIFYQNIIVEKITYRHPQFWFLKLWLIRCNKESGHTGVYSCVLWVAKLGLYNMEPKIFYKGPPKNYCWKHNIPPSTILISDSMTEYRGLQLVTRFCTLISTVELLQTFLKTARGCKCNHITLYFATSQTDRKVLYLKFN